MEDPHNGEVNQGYYNQSIYFDSHDLAHYREKQEGQNVRVKVRLRAHKKMPDGEPTRYFIELKHRFGAVSKKDRYILDENQAMDVLNGRTLPGLTPDHDRQNTDDVPASFYYLSRKSIFQPVVSVLYHRAAYHSKMYPGIRLTYDTGVRASSLISFDSPLSSFYPSLDPRHCVIELKYPSVAPRLLLKRLNELGLQQITLSKYSSAVGPSSTNLSVLPTPAIPPSVNPGSMESGLYSNAVAGFVLGSILFILDLSLLYCFALFR